MRNRLTVARWVRSSLARDQRVLGRFHLDNRKGVCDPARAPDLIKSTSSGTVLADRYASALLTVYTRDGCLNGSLHFMHLQTAAWDLRTRERLGLFDLVDLTGGWSPEQALAQAINRLPSDCLYGATEESDLVQDTYRPRLQDRWTLHPEGLAFHLYREEASTSNACPAQSVLIEWSDLPLTELGSRVARG